MTWKQRARDNRRRLEASDLRVNRGIGVVALLIGAIFVWSLVFSPFDERVRFQWNVTPDGGRTPMTHVTCPSPWAVLVHGAEPEIITTDGFCIMPSRALVAEGVIVGALSIVVASWFFTRTTRPGPIHPLPLSSDRENRKVMS